MALTNQTLTFGNVLSSDYGVYISGEGVFNAPKRDAKLITIPGRNGDFVQDNGRFENITITYPCFYKGSSVSNIATTLANYKNALCSQLGYQKLADTITPSYYREAVLVDGINFEIVKDSTLATFDLVFNCKPQRWHTSYQTLTAITNNTNLANPSKFAGQPLLKVVGYGDINLGAQSLRVDNNPIGLVSLMTPKSYTFPATTGVKSGTYALSSGHEALKTGDTITCEPIDFVYNIATGGTLTDVLITSETGYADATTTVAKESKNATVTTTFSGLTFAYGTTKTVTRSFNMTVNYNPQQVYGLAVTLSINYDSGTNRITYNMVGGASTGNITVTPSWAIGAINGYSTKTISDPLYIDCETGLAWYDSNGPIVDANNLVIFPIDLPELPPGNNLITYSNTFSSFELAQRLYWI